MQTPCQREALHLGICAFFFSLDYVFSFFRGFHRVKIFHFPSFNFARHRAVNGRSPAGPGTSEFLLLPRCLWILRNGRLADNTNGGRGRQAVFSLCQSCAQVPACPGSVTALSVLLCPLLHHPHRRQSAGGYRRPASKPRPAH